jgi:hypothetical protein
MTSAGLPASLADWVLLGRDPLPHHEEEAATWTDAAAAHGLAGRLATAALRQTAWPPRNAERLRNLFALELRRVVCQAESAHHLRAGLAAAGIRTLPLKGAALVDRLYDSPAERPMVDVDVLVLDRWPEALAAVHSWGWRVADEADHAVAFEDPRTGVMLELHHSITSCPGFHPLDTAGLWDRSEATADGGRVPCAEDLLVQLAQHAAFQHGFAVSLVQLLDVRRLLERLPLDVARLASIASAARAERALGATLLVARRRVGAPVADGMHAAFVAPLPARFGRWLEGMSPRESAASLARARWELAAGRRLELLRRTLSPASAQHRDRAGATAMLRRAGSLLRRWALPIAVSAWRPRFLSRRG